MAAGASTLPFVSTGEEMDIRTDQASGPSFLVRQVRATEGYFRTMRVPLLSGRGFDGADLGQRLAVVSLEFERQFFSGSAVGQRFWPSSANEPFTIIGVVGDVRTPPLSEENTTLFYTLSGLVSEFVVRTSEGPELVLPRLRSAVQAYDSATIVTSMSTMDARLRGSIAPQRFRATLSEAFGYSALFLAAVGLYGLVSRRITDRRREFGIRMALGARQADIRTLIFSDGLKTVGIGLVAGVPLAVGASTFLRSLLFGISPGEATVYFWATTVLAGAAVFAMGMAIRRAGRIDPISELRL